MIHDNYSLFQTAGYTLAPSWQAVSGVVLGEFQSKVNAGLTMSLVLRLASVFAQAVATAQTS